ncbi:MAG: HlyD family efflux transporter periplasmic adaptor subunit [Bacteroidota bacterium]
MHTPILRLRSLRSLIIWMAIGSLVVTMIGCTESTAQSDASEVDPTAAPTAADYLLKSSLDLQTITPATATTYATISGRVVPATQSKLASEVQGVIKAGSVPFKVGSKFKAGQVLLQIDQSEFEYQVKARKAAFLNALTTILSDLKSDYPDSYPAWFNYVADYDAEDKIAPLPKPNSDQEKFFLATYQISSQYYEIKGLEQRLAKYQIIAPYNGQVLEVMTDIGSMINPGQPLGRINSRANYEIEAAAGASVAQKLRVGQQMMFRDERGDQEWTAQLVRKSENIDPNTQNVPLYFSIRGAGVMPGLYLEASAVTEALTGVNTIPTSALNRDNTVLILLDGAVQSKAVEPVVYQVDSVIVSGLAAGDQVILNDFPTPVIGKIVR